MTTHVNPQNLATTRSTDVSSAKLRTKIGRTYRFESAHFLPCVPDGHKCRNMHGHNYRIEVVIACEALDERGFVMDFAEVDADVLPLIKKVDHRVLNGVEGLENPTAEIIAAWFFQRIRGCESVRVYENDDCWAEVRASRNSR